MKTYPGAAICWSIIANVATGRKRHRNATVRSAALFVLHGPISRLADRKGLLNQSGDARALASLIWRNRRSIAPYIATCGKSVIDTPAKRLYGTFGPQTESGRAAIRFAKGEA